MVEETEQFVNKQAKEIPVPWFDILHWEESSACGHR